MRSHFIHSHYQAAHSGWNVVTISERATAGAVTALVSQATGHSRRHSAHRYRPLTGRISLLWNVLHHHFVVRSIIGTFSPAVLLHLRDQLAPSSEYEVSAGLLGQNGTLWCQVCLSVGGPIIAPKRSSASVRPMVRSFRTGPARLAGTNRGPAGTPL